MPSYPIAEIFHSVQGEGVHTGTPMLFIRLAGCNVGEYLPVDRPPIYTRHDLPLLTDGTHSACTAVSGERFLCDTDYHRTLQQTPAELVLQLAGEEHVCITGGEPFLHDLGPLLQILQRQGVMSHIETSGTKPIAIAHETVDRSGVWVTCAPKRGLLPGVLEDVDEVKYLVGKDTSSQTVETFLATVPASLLLRERVFLSPINGVEVCNVDSLDNCLRLLRQFPKLRLSAQLHKYIQVR